MKGEKELRKMYNDAGRELRSLLSSVNLASFNGRIAADVGSKADRIVTALNIDVQKWADFYLREAYRIGAGKSRTALEILGKKPRNLLLNTERLYIDSTVELLVHRNSTIRRSVGSFLTVATLAAGRLESAQIQEWSYGEEAVSAIEMDLIVDQALVGQKTRTWLSKTLAEYLLASNITDGNFIEINGRMWKLSTYSKLVGRTTLRSAQSRATEDLCRQYDNDLVEISSHGTTCESEICQPYEGNVFSISGKTPGYEILDEWPPFHPNCEHSALPTSEEAIEVRGRWH
jgi:hypothetical protein